MANKFEMKQIMILNGFIDFYKVVTKYIMAWKDAAWSKLLKRSTWVNRLTGDIDKILWNISFITSARDFFPMMIYFFIDKD